MAITRVNDRGQLEVQYPGIQNAWSPAIAILPSTGGLEFKLIDLQASDLQQVREFSALISTYIQGPLTDAIDSIGNGLNSEQSGIQSRLIAVDVKLTEINASIEELVAPVQKIASETALTPKIQNLLVQTSGTEYVISIPERTHKFVIKCRGDVDDTKGNLRVSWSQGAVTTPTSTVLIADGYDSVPVGSLYFEESIYLRTATPIYLSCDEANVPIAVHTWRSSAA